MIISTGLVLLSGYLLGGVFQRLGVPKIIGMLLAGIVLGPFVLNVLSPDLLNIGADIRYIALVVILIKAGLTLDIKDLKKIGRPAVLMAFLPATMEIFATTVFAALIFKISVIEAALMGAVIAAVSPAVVVPRMVSLIEDGVGQERKVPQLVLTGASLDDVFAISVFSALLPLAGGGAISGGEVIFKAGSVLVQIGSAAVIGMAAGWIIGSAAEKMKISSIQTCILLFAVSLMTGLLEKIMPFASLLSIMVMAMTVKKNLPSSDIYDSADFFGKIWDPAQIMLFGLVGATVNIGFAFKAGPMVIMLLMIVLIFRIIGVWICLIGTNLNLREKIFCMISYIPKATVQAAIGGVPMAAGLGVGPLILTTAVVSIIVTAPTGAWGMDIGERLLSSKR